MINNNENHIRKSKENFEELREEFIGGAIKSAFKKIAGFLKDAFSFLNPVNAIKVAWDWITGKIGELFAYIIGNAIDAINKSEVFLNIFNGLAWFWATVIILY